MHIPLLRFGCIKSYMHVGGVVFFLDHSKLMVLIMLEKLAQRVPNLCLCVFGPKPFNFDSEVLNQAIRCTIDQLYFLLCVDCIFNPTFGKSSVHISTHFLVLFLSPTFEGLKLSLLLLVLYKGQNYQFIYIFLRG